MRRRRLQSTSSSRNLPGGKFLLEVRCREREEPRTRVGSVTLTDYGSAETHDRRVFASNQRFIIEPISLVDVASQFAVFSLVSFGSSQHPSWVTASYEQQNDSRWSSESGKKLWEIQKTHVIEDVHNSWLYCFIVKQYNQKLCISSVARCFTKRLQSRPLK